VSGLLTVAERRNPPNVGHRDAAERVGLACRLLPSELVATRTRPQDLVLGRVDVARSLTGPEFGSGVLRRHEETGIRSTA